MARDDNPAQSATSEWPLTTHEKEHSRLVVEGKRADDGDRCTVVVIHERSGYWGVYPHGFGKFGVRLPRAEAVKLAHAILDRGGLDDAAQLGVRLPRAEAVRVARAILDGVGLNDAE